MTPDSKLALEHALHSAQREHDRLKARIESMMEEVHGLLDERSVLIDKIANLKEDISKS